MEAQEGLGTEVKRYGKSCSESAEVLRPAFQVF